MATTRTTANDRDTMETRLADAGATLDRLSATARDLGGAVRDEVQGVLDELGRERDRLATKLQEVRARDDHAWEDYRQRVGRAHERFDAELEIAEAELRRRRAATRTEFGDTVDEELAAWRRRIDELRLQAELGRMETKDELEPIIAAMQRRRSRLEQRLREMHHASEDTWQWIRDDITDRLAQLRHSLGEAEETLED